jgi:hypothetical protein
VAKLHRWRIPEQLVVGALTVKAERVKRQRVVAEEQSKALLVKKKACELGKLTCDFQAAFCVERFA